MSSIYAIKSQLQTKKSAFILASGTTTFCSIALIGLAGYWYTLRVAKFESTICFMADAVTAVDIDPGMLKRLILKNDKDTNRGKYCGKVSDILDHVAATKTKEKYNGDSNPEYFSPNLEEFNCRSTRYRSGDKLQLQHIVANVPPVQRKPTKVFWETTPSSTNKLKYIAKEGAVYVQKSGLYYVSSQLTATIENRTISSNYNLTIRHLVYLISSDKRTENILLESEKSTCEMTVEMSELTSTIGAIFSLRAHDRIYVATSHPNHILSNPSKSFLSIYMA